VCSPVPTRKNVRVSNIQVGCQCGCVCVKQQVSEGGFFLLSMVSCIIAGLIWVILAAILEWL